MRALVVDDHPVFREGLKFLLNTYFKKCDVITLENGEELLVFLHENRCDIILLDVDMPGKNGIDICEIVNKNYPGQPIVILTMHKDLELVRLAFYNGAKAFLIKENTTDELIECVEEVLSGRSYISKEIRETNKLDQPIDKKEYKVKELLKSLSKIEIEILILISRKYSSKEIAVRCFVTAKSVDNYRSRICKKINLDAQKNSLLVWALDNKRVLEKFSNNPLNDRII